MPNKQLINFIEEARKRDFNDFQIKEPLLKKGWPLNEIEKAFSVLKPNIEFKNKITIFVDYKILKILEKRAKKNMFTISEQIEDILRRSAINAGKIKREEEKLDDLLVSLFSRKTYKK